jgi:hypothetical protein
MVYKTQLFTGGMAYSFSGLRRAPETENTTYERKNVVLMEVWALLVRRHGGFKTNLLGF